MAIQDDAKNFLLSALSRTGGDLPSLQIAWLATQGYTTGTIDDRWKAYLSANAYYLPEGLSRLLVGLNLAVGNNWLPNLLYQEGDILLWYDPSDLTTMFKDTAGTQPVTADGDSVALMLDKGQWGGKTLSQVLAAQPELESGFGPLATSGDTTSVHPGAVVGKKYYWDVEITDYVSGTFFFNYGDVSDAGLTPPEGNQQFTSNGRRTFMLTAPANTVSFRVRGSGGPVATVTIHAIREIPGYHRTQATGTSMPKYKTGPNPAAAETSAEFWAHGDVVVSGESQILGDQHYRVYSSAGAGSEINMPGATIGQPYRVEFTVNSITGSIRIGDTGSIISAAGTYSEVLTPAADRIHIKRQTPCDADITNVSVKEIPASAPYIHWLLYDGTDDSTQTPTIPFGTVTSDGAARRNLLTEPDKFDHTTWVKTNTTVTANAAAAPDGTATADLLLETTTSAVHSTGKTAVLTAGWTATASIKFKKSPISRDWAYITMSDNAAHTYLQHFDIVTGVLGNGVASVGTPTLAGRGIEDLGDGWYLCHLTVTMPGGSAANCGISFGTTPAGTVTSYTGDITYGVYIVDAQLELGSTATAFQNIGTDEVAACVGVTKSSDAAAGVVAELSATSASNNGTFALLAPSAAAADYFWRTKGTGASDQTRTTYAAPTTDVITGMGKIATDTNRFRIDADEATAATDQGTGNFGDFVLNFGRRGGATLPFNGKEHQTVIRSRLLSASELSSLETFVAAKTGVIL